MKTSTQTSKQRSILGANSMALHMLHNHCTAPQQQQQQQQQRQQRQQRQHVSNQRMQLTTTTTINKSTTASTITYPNCNNDNNSVTMALVNNNNNNKNRNNNNSYRPLKINYLIMLSIQAIATISLLLSIVIVTTTEATLHDDALTTTIIEHTHHHSPPPMPPIHDQSDHYVMDAEEHHPMHHAPLPPPPPPPAPIAPAPQYSPEPSPCVLNIKSTSNNSSSYPGSVSLSYLSNYVTSGRKEPYFHKGSQICITARDVDEAVEEAKASLGGYVPKEIYTANSEHPRPVHVTVVAEIITQATRILANRFKLPEPAILYDLPSIDLTKSHSIEKICPIYLKPSVNCEQSQYRTLTGFCNNLQYQSWGASRSAMVRFLAPDYYDSISLPRRAYDGSPLPSARVISFVVHQDPPEYDKYHSMLSVVWGQFIDHDMTLAVMASDEQSTSSADRVDCCKSEDAHPDCFPIKIPKGDPFYGYFNQKCMHFTRASPGLQPGCSLGPVQAINKISSYMDGNLIYGSGIKQAQRLRTYSYGQLRSQPVGSANAYGGSSLDHLNGGSTDQYGPHPQSPGQNDYLLTAATSAAASLYKELLPANRHSPDTGCERRGRSKDVYCFEAGDERANEQIQLTTMHTIFLREHNRVAKLLSYINPYWNDERLYQEARQIVVAEMQHITFNEFLPLVIGKDKIYEYGLELEHPGKYYQGYDHKINAGVRVEFQAAAFRYGHSILPSYIERYNKYHQKIEAIRLSKLLKQPYDLYHPGVLDTYALGLINQRAGRMDPTLTTEVTNHLFETPGKLFGLDLAAINVQRGRDMGVPGYNHFREYCGLSRAKYFEDLTGVFSNKTLLRMSQIYKHVDDIDLWTAGISEYPIHDGLVGPTFACLIARQFVNLRRGDRYWYENSGYPPQFTIEQLDEIRKSTSARLLCENADDIETIQASPMLVADPYTNPRVPCSSLPTIDLSKWKDLSSSYPESMGAPQPEQPVDNNVAYGNNQRGAYSNMEQYEGNSSPLNSMNSGPAYPPPESYPGPMTGMNNPNVVDHIIDEGNYQGEAYQKSKAA